MDMIIISLIDTYTEGTSCIKCIGWNMLQTTLDATTCSTPSPARQNWTQSEKAYTHAVHDEVPLVSDSVPHQAPGFTVDCVRFSTRVML